MENHSVDEIRQLPQPLGFFHVITNGDALHYGYWPDDSELSLLQAQKQHSALLIGHLPKPPCRVLDVGCGLGMMAGELHALGYELTAIAPSDSLIAYASKYHPGPKYIDCGFLDDEPALDEVFDVILFQESLQYFSDLDAVFQKVKNLLKEDGRLLMCDEVSYKSETRKRSAVHEAASIEEQFARHGFAVVHHHAVGQQVLPTCHHVLAGLENKQEQMVAIFGPQAKEQLVSLIAEWRNLKGWYEQGIFGYEFWELKPTPYSVKVYNEGDEHNIVEQFNEVFQAGRSLEHWQWKFLNNPQGGPCATIAWDKHDLAAHYAAYPLALIADERPAKTFQIVDTFTSPKWRGVGQGKTSLLSRTVRLFHKIWCEGQVDFFYGFNTGKIQKLGKRFLSYEPVAPVYEYHLEAEDLNRQKYKRLIRAITKTIKGYRIEIVEQSGQWANDLLSRAKEHYSILVNRDQAYLQWRYDDHPDFQYQYILLKHWGKTVGWCVIRQEENGTVLLVDALTAETEAGHLVEALHEFAGSLPQFSKMSGWFSENPQWWHQALLKGGFARQRQFQQLDLCITFFSDRYSKESLKQQFYFTMGDSDLY